MTQRSIQAGKTPTVIVRAGMDVQVEGWDEERVFARTGYKGGLQVERRSESALAHVRARAKLGDRMLFDWNADLFKRDKEEGAEDAIQVRVGNDVVVHVPYGSMVKVCAGGSIEVRDVRGSITAYAARDVQLHKVRALVHASAGRTMDVDCESLAEDNVNLSAGRDLRFCIWDVNDVTIRVDDLSGYWEGVIGGGQRQIHLYAGGDVTLVTEQPVTRASCSCPLALPERLGQTGQRV